MNTSKELSLLNQKIVFNITKFTTTDFVNHLSCIVWFTKCNMRCLYCYNDDIVYAKEGNYTLNDLYDFLRSRVGLLDAVVLSGGEATLNDLFSICKEIKEMGFKIKLDTNGLKPELIEQLISNNLIDFISLDFKAPKYKFKEVTGIHNYDDFESTLKYLISSNLEFEVRTTVHGKLLNTEDINVMIDSLCEFGYENTFYIQSFLETPSNIGNLTSDDIYFDISKINKDKLNIVYRD